MMTSHNTTEAKRREKIENIRILLLVPMALVILILLCDERPRQEILNAGYNDYLSKPVDHSMFHQTLGKYLAVKGTRQLQLGKVE